MVTVVTVPVTVPIAITPEFPSVSSCLPPIIADFGFLVGNLSSWSVVPIVAPELGPIEPTVSEIALTRVGMLPTLISC